MPISVVLQQQWHIRFQRARKQMIVPAMMVGVLGYILGNYYGAIVWSIIH